MTGRLLVAALCLVVSSVDAQENTETTTNITNATAPVVPYLNGRWKVNFRYSELKGNVGMKSGCQGVWPYIYSIEYEVYQHRGSPEYVLCRVGDDCVGNLYTVKTLRQASPKAFEENCELREHGLLESGFDTFVMTSYARSMQLPDIWESHTTEFETEYGHARDALGKKIMPNTWNRWKVPGQMEVITKAMTPEQKQLVKEKADAQPWGRICDQFDWPDIAALGPGFASPFYAGTKRHENMTWIWIKDISSCRCFPDCMSCYYHEPDTSPQFYRINETCIAQFGDQIDEHCDYKIVGVGGGPVIYPPATTGREVDDNGRPLICYQYTQIDGFRTLPASKVLIPPGIILKGAASTVPVPWLSILLSMFLCLTLEFSHSFPASA